MSSKLYRAHRCKRDRICSHLSIACCSSGGVGWGCDTLWWCIRVFVLWLLINGSSSRRLKLTRDTRVVHIQIFYGARTRITSKCGTININGTGFPLCAPVAHDCVISILVAVARHMHNSRAHRGVVVAINSPLDTYQFARRADQVHYVVLTHLYVPSSNTYKCIYFN